MCRCRDQAVLSTTTLRGFAHVTIPFPARRSVYPVPRTRNVVRSLVEPLEPRRLLTTTADWHLNESAPATTAADSSANNHALILAGNATFAAGRLGNAITLDGLGDYASAPNLVDTTDSFTLSAWVNLGTNLGFGGGPILSQSGALANQFQLSFQFKQSKVQFSMAAEETGGGLPATAIATDDLQQWTHLAGVYDDSANEIRLYVDGALESSAPFNGGGWASDRSFLVGARANPDQTIASSFKGLLDDVRVDDVALTAAQVATLAATSVGGLSVDNAYEDSAAISWDEAAPNETGFDVEVTPASGTAFVLSAPAHAGTGRATFDVSGLGAATTYAVRVRPVTSSGNGPWSETKSVVTTAPVLAYDWADAFGTGNATNVVGVWDAVTNSGGEHQNDSATLTLSNLPRHAFIDVFAGFDVLHEPGQGTWADTQIVAQFEGKGNAITNIPMIRSREESLVYPPTREEYFNTDNNVHGYAFADASGTATIRFTGSGFTGALSWKQAYTEIRVALPAVGVVVDKPSVNEGDDELGRTLHYTVTRTKPTGLPDALLPSVTVPLDWSGTISPGSDLEGTPQTQVMLPVGTTSASIAVVVKDDDLLEETETLIATVKRNPAYGFANSSAPSATASVLDHKPTVSVVATDDAAAETFGAVPVDPGSFTVSRTGGTTYPLEVYFTVGGSATEGDGTTGSGDYDRLPGSVETSGYVHHVTIPAGQSGKTFSVTPVKDLPRVFEGEETISLTLVQIPQAPLVPLTYMLEPPPATGPSAHPTTAAVKLHDGEIVPGDSAQDNVDNGGEVPSTKAGQAGAFGHYVSPKAADKIVVLKAKALQAGQNFDDFYQWQVDGQSKAARADGSLELSRADAAVFDVLLRDKRQNVANKVLDHWKVWIVWSTIGKGKPLDDVTKDDGQGLVLTQGYRFIHSIEPLEMFDTDKDIPDLTGTDHGPVPAPGAVNYRGLDVTTAAEAKWDSSQQIRQKFINPANLVTVGDITFATDYLDFPSAADGDGHPGGLGAVAADLVPLIGNDDVLSFYQGFNDPYPADNKAKLRNFDQPSRAMDHVTGVNGNTVEWRLHFIHFTRLEIAGRWYRISTDFPWRVHFKMKKVAGLWVDNGSEKATDNAGF